MRALAMAGALGCTGCTCGGAPDAPRGVEGESNNAALLRKRRAREGWYASPTPEPDPPVVDYERLDSGVPPLPPKTPPGDPRLARSLFDPPVTVTSTKWDLKLAPIETYYK